MFVLLRSVGSCLVTCVLGTLLVVTSHQYSSGENPKGENRNDGESNALSSQSLTYEQAFRKAQEERKPLLILVGADWCQACKTMKSDTIIPMRDSGAFKDVVFTQLDKDAQPEIANEVKIGRAHV